MKKETSIDYPKVDYNKYTRVIIGTPIWTSAISTPIRSFLKDFGHNIKSRCNTKELTYGIFYTCGGTPHSLVESSIKKESEQIVGKAPYIVKGLNSNEFQSKSIWITRLKDFFENPE